MSGIISSFLLELELHTTISDSIFYSWILSRILYTMFLLKKLGLYATFLYLKHELYDLFLLNFELYAPFCLLGKFEPYIFTLKLKLRRISPSEIWALYKFLLLKFGLYDFWTCIISGTRGGPYTAFWRSLTCIHLFTSETWAVYTFLLLKKLGHHKILQLLIFESWAVSPFSFWNLGCIAFFLLELELSIMELELCTPFYFW